MILFQKELVRIMVDADMEAVGLRPIGEGRRGLSEKFGGWYCWETSVSATYGRGGRGMEV